MMPLLAVSPSQSLSLSASMMATTADIQIGTHSKVSLMTPAVIELSRACGDWPNFGSLHIDFGAEPSWPYTKSTCTMK